MPKIPPITDRQLTDRDWVLISLQSWTPFQRTIIAIFRGRSTDEISVEEIKSTSRKRLEVICRSMITGINTHLSRSNLPYRIRVTTRGQVWPSTKLKMVIVDNSA